MKPYNCVQIICIRLEYWIAYNCANKWLLLIRNGGARGVMVIVAGYGHGDTRSNPGPDWLYFT